MDMWIKYQVKLGMLTQPVKNAKSFVKMMLSVFLMNFAIIGVTRNMDSLTPTNALSITKAFRKVMHGRTFSSALKVKGFVFIHNFSKFV